jgi:hypothetical protein
VYLFWLSLFNTPTKLSRSKETDKGLSMLRFDMCENLRWSKRLLEKKELFVVSA